MALRKRGKWWYADSQADIREELSRFGALNGYVPTEFADAKCTCGSTTFNLLIDEETGVAIRVCTACSAKHPMGDSGEYLEGADLEEAACVCGAASLEIAIGVSLNDDSEDVRWLYVGCRCPSCGLTACYGDWKNEYLGYRKLLENI